MIVLYWWGRRAGKGSSEAKFALEVLKVKEGERKGGKRLYMSKSAEEFKTLCRSVRISTSTIVPTKY